MMDDLCSMIGSMLINDVIALNVIHSAVFFRLDELISVNKLVDSSMI